MFCRNFLLQTILTILAMSNLYVGRKLVRHNHFAVNRILQNMVPELSQPELLGYA